MTAFESIKRQRITLSRFSLLYLSALPSHPTSISAPLTYPQCLAVATLISFKLLQKKKKEKEKTNKPQKPAATRTSPGTLKPSCTYPCVVTPMLVSSPCPPCPPPARLPQGFKEEMKEEGSCLYQTKRQQTQFQACTSVVAAASCRPSVQYGGLLLNPGPRGPCPEQGVQRVLM